MRSNSHNFILQPHAEEVAQKLKPEKAKAKKEEASAAPAAPKVVKPKVPKEASKHAPPPPKIETPGEKVRHSGDLSQRGICKGN